MNAIIRRDPHVGVNGMKRFMDRFFDDRFFGIHRYSAPTHQANPMPIDVTADDKQVVIQASLPGVKPDNVNVSVEDNRLTIEGETHSADDSENDRYVIRERRSGAFHRSLTLPQGLEEDNIEARFENGVLTLTVPRTVEVKAKTIEIKTG